MADYVCDSCGKTVPSMNKTIHAAQCRGPIAPLANSSSEIDLELGDTPQPKLTRQGSSQGSGKSKRPSLDSSMLVPTNWLPQSISSKITPPGYESGKRNGSAGSGGSGKQETVNPIPTFYCRICLENCALTTQYIIATCTNQEHKFCETCLSGYTAVQADSAVTQHGCPGGGECGGVLTNEEVRLLLKDNATSLAHFERFLLVANNDYRECPGCQKGTSNGSVSQPEIKCDGCGLVYCFIHANAHPNEECIKYAQRMLKDEKEFNELLEKTTKECPKCKSHTEKNGGCNHMVHTHVI